jgi:hypothetical protein
MPLGLACIEDKHGVYERKPKVKHLILALLAATFSLSVSAATPQNGWYYSAVESGRGFNIEIQGNTLFMSGFVYDATGIPMWFVSGGPMSSDNTYSGAAYRTSNGQPLGGSYRAATAVPFGNATITFPTTMDANIAVNGFNFTVTREIFGFDPAAPYAGTWALKGTLTAAGSFCERDPQLVNVEMNEGVVVVDSNGNFFQMDDAFPALLALSGTITPHGSISLTSYGDTLRPGNYTCPLGTGSGAMTDLNKGSGILFQGGGTWTFTLTRQ